MKMFKFIKDMVGKLTIPNETIYRCKLGDYWVSIHGLPSLDEKFNSVISYDNPFNYREIKQNKYGKWEYKDSYLGLNSELSTSEDYK
jgi:hypothetical protein